MFKRVLIANRGEVALRIIKACRKLGVETVAVYSTADRDSPHLEAADHTACIGPGPSGQSYLNREALLQTAGNYECQALHPGFGFLAEDAQFAAMCQQHKITFIGPSARSIELMGSKARAKQTIQETGLSVIPGSDGHLSSLDSALRLAEGIGYPVLLKAAAGGGGKGIRPCHTPEDVRRNFREAAIEAEKAFGSDRLYLEKLITSGRHIEFQILADSYDQVVHLGERECSIQRKNQKLIEESPSPAIDTPTRNKTGKRLVSAIRRIGYQNAGTVEFLRDPEGHLYFMEMNTRLQVEHPVTEEICGVDIVAAQIQIAANHPLPAKQKEIRFSGHAIECRINAEDPDKNFQPSPGKITGFQIPLSQGPGRVRLETHVREGYRIPSFYDSMICKVIAWGKDRAAAIETMIRTLDHSSVRGIKTTIPLHIKILKSNIFQKGKTHTDSLEKIMGGK